MWLIRQSDVSNSSACYRCCHELDGSLPTEHLQTGLYRVTDISTSLSSKFRTKYFIKNAVWNVAPCRSCVNRRFRGTYRFHLQIIKIHERGNNVSRWQPAASSKTSVHTRSTRRNIPEDGILHSHRWENKPYKVFYYSTRSPPDWLFRWLGG
jgi:hypothetical protein